ncbi:MAG: ATP-binding protein [Proteobacteria bacterium]|uniref:ATP-binding protein n=1 Tax=Candidatus Avisuccinivibrio stercorigallinarum TaxID=2840704 RepID=A0A9D9DB41_9GAMM|nr:ATP-binding protein [Candidatus Avisuccinivibrio stercorigallinarum]
MITKDLNEITREDVVNLCQETPLSRAICASFVAQSSDDRFPLLHFNAQFYVVMHDYLDKLAVRRIQRGKDKAGMPKVTMHEISQEPAHRNQFEQITNWINSASIEEQRDVFCIGETGVGKTNFAMNILNELIKRGFKVHYYDYCLLIYSLRCLLGTEGYNQKLDEFSKHKAVLLDDFLFRPVLPGEVEILKDIIDRCHSNGCSIIITTQVAEKDWKAHLGSGLAVDACIDRLCNGPFIVKFAGKSYRSREAEHMDINNQQEEA